MPRKPSELKFSPLPDREREICLRFREIRLANGMKQEPFAETLNIPLARLKSYEHARAPIRYDLGNDVCSEFEINQRWLAIGTLPKKGYFPIEPMLQAQLPKRELFSKIFDRVFSALFDSQIKELVKIYTDSGKESDLKNWSIMPRIAPIGARPESTKAFLLDNLYGMLSLTVYTLPSNLMEVYFNHIYSWDKDFSIKHLKEIETYRKTRKQREEIDCLIYKNYVSDALSGKKCKLP